MLEFWIPMNYIPTNERPVGYLYRCYQIFLKDTCNDCGANVHISKNGDKNNGSYTIGCCNHMLSWQYLWNNRIIVNNTSNVICKPGLHVSNISMVNIDNKIKIDPTNDGAKCKGSCGNWVPMAIDDGNFVCYSCRSGF